MKMTQRDREYIGDLTTRGGGYCPLEGEEDPEPDREQLKKDVCKFLLREHADLQKFLSGFGKPEVCKCPGCTKARIILGKELTK